MLLGNIYNFLDENFMVFYYIFKYANYKTNTVAAQWLANLI